MEETKKRPNNQIMRKSRFILITLLLILFSCNSSKMTSEQTKKGNVISTGKYQITQIKGIDKLIKSPTMNFDFEKKTVNGDAGCNRYGGGFSLEKRKIKFGQMRATRMYCVEFATIETTFLESLSLVDNYTIESREVRFYDAENSLLLTGEKVE